MLSRDPYLTASAMLLFPNESPVCSPSFPAADRTMGKSKPRSGAACTVEFQSASQYREAGTGTPELHDPAAVEWTSARQCDLWRVPEEGTKGLGSTLFGALEIIDSRFAREVSANRIQA